MKYAAPLCVKFARIANEIPRGGVKCLLAGVGKEKNEKKKAHVSL